MTLFTLQLVQERQTHGFTLLACGPHQEIHLLRLNYPLGYPGYREKLGSPRYRGELGYPRYQMLRCCLILILETLIFTDSSSNIWSSQKIQSEFGLQEQKLNLIFETLLFTDTLKHICRRSNQDNFGTRDDELYRQIFINLEQLEGSVKTYDSKSRS